MADEDTPDVKDGTERRVYNLPASLVARLRAFKSNQGLASETEAVRRLLDTALQMRDSVTDILDNLSAKHAEEKDLRALAADILSRHILVTGISFEDDAIWFRLNSRERGKITNAGRLYTGKPDALDDDWDLYVKAPRGGPKVKAPSWEPPGGSDLDDEIPF